MSEPGQGAAEPAKPEPGLTGEGALLRLAQSQLAGMHMLRETRGLVEVHSAQIGVLAALVGKALGLDIGQMTELLKKARDVVEEVPDGE